MKRIITILTIMLTSLSLMATTTYAVSDSQLFAACNNTNDKASHSPICSASKTTANPATHIINVAANIIALLGGVAAVILIIMSGFTLVTSGGNQESVANARKRIVAALAGIIIIAVAWSITRFVTDKIIK